MVFKPRFREARLRPFNPVCIPATLLCIPATLLIAAGIPAVAAPETIVKAAAQPDVKVTWPQPDIDRTVTDADGKPLAGVKVVWYGIILDTRRPDPSTIKTVELTTATTDAQGKFHIDGKTAWSASAFAEAWIQADGYAMMGSLAVPPGSAVDPNKTPIVLVKPTALHLRLVNAQNQPVPGVAVRPFVIQKDAQTAVLPDERRKPIISAADGTIDFKDLPQGWNLMLQVQDDRFAQPDFMGSQIQLGKTDRTDAPDLHLKASSTLEGTVTYGPAGKPAAGINVTATESPFHGSSPGTATTDAIGHFKIARIGGGSYAISAMLAPPIAAQWLSPQVMATVPPGGSKTGLKVALLKGVLLNGHASFTGSHKPAAGINIYVGTQIEHRVVAPNTVTTDAKGNFQARVMPGMVSIYPQQDGPVTPTLIKVVEGKTAIAELEIAAPIPPITIKGVVQDSAGKPVSGADVFVGTSSYNVPPPTTTDPDGKFTLQVPGASMAFLRASQGRNATVSDTVALNGDYITLKLADNALVDVTGLAVDTAGKPIAGATVSIYEQNLRVGTNIPAATTDDKGAYHFTGLMPGTRYSISVSMKHYGNGNVSDVVLQPGAAFTAQNAVLHEANSFVGGHVVNSKGTPLSGATVSWMENQDTKATTDKSGKFHLDGVPSGEVVIQINAPNESTAQQVTSGKDNVVIRTYSQTDQADQQANQPKPVEYVGKYAPEFSVANWVNVSPVTMSDLKGKIIVFDCWGCCSDNLFEVQRVIQQFGGRGVVGIGLNVAGGSLADVQAHVAQEHLTMPVAIDKDNGNGTAKGLGTNGFEAYAIVGRDGKIAYSGWEFQPMLQKLGIMLAAENAVKQIK